MPSATAASIGFGLESMTAREKKLLIALVKDG
jgi:hypothetical protein